MTARSIDFPPLHVLEHGQSGYPERLALALGDKAPSPLYAQGALELLNAQGIGFCGSRNASDKGLDIAKDCAKQAVEAGKVVVSGNARGVDRVVHRTALEHGGATILVLPEGVERFRIHSELTPHWNWERTLVLSQFPPNLGWKAWNAMARNKTILALVDAMVVIEAGQKGGTLEAGKQALKCNIPLFVVYRSDMENASIGGLELLHRGGRRLNKNAKLERADMPEVFKAMRDHRRNASLLRSPPKQAPLW